jgi:Holliday junction resolvase RusA-like endonuclease
VDNLIKAVADALTELGVWNDDSQVVEMRDTKLTIERAS